MAYRNYQRLNLPPLQPWLSGPYSQIWLGEHGGMKDDLVARARAAVQARMPGVGPPDALPLIASERQIDRSPTDTDATFAEALRTAWDLYPYAGTARGVLTALARLGYPNVAHVQANGVLTLRVGGFGGGFGGGGVNNAVVLSDLGGAPPRWTFDLNPAMWSRFALIWYAPFPASWTAVTNPPTGATAPSLDEVNRIRHTVKRWQRAASTCVSLSVIVAGRAWGYPPHVWGSGTWGGNTVVQWSP